MSSILIASNLELNWLSKILEVKNIQLYFAFLFVFLGFNFKHLRGTTYRKTKKLVNYKITYLTKISTIFIIYSSMINFMQYFNIYYNIQVLNNLFLLYLPYYLDLAEYSGKRRILMPSYFHTFIYTIHRFIGNFKLINENNKLDIDINNLETYILSIHPHGLFPFGSVGSLSLPHDLKYIEETTPILNSKYLKAGIASFCFYIPIIREVYLWLGAVDCSKPILKNFLQKGYSIAIFVGGAQESQYSGIGSTKSILKNRDGIFKLALETGSNLVPVYTFGNNNMFNSFDFDILGIFYYLKKLTGIWLPRGYFVPMRHNFTSVIGSPIKVDKLTINDNIDFRVKQLKDHYMLALSELFEKYKYLDPYCMDKSIEYV